MFLCILELLNVKDIFVETLYSSCRSANSRGQSHLRATVGEVESREDSRSSEMNLSSQEKAFIRELRSNQAVVDVNALPPPPPPSADEEAYASILGPVTVFYRVHAYCLGMIALSSGDLKREVKKELRISEGW